HIRRGLGVRADAERREDIAENAHVESFPVGSRARRSGADPLRMFPGDGLCAERAVYPCASLLAPLTRSAVLMSLPTVSLKPAPIAPPMATSPCIFSISARAA